MSYLPQSLFPRVTSALRTMFNSSASPLAATAGLVVSTVVSELPPLRPREKGGRPAHHADDTGRKFINPWGSFRMFSPLEAAGLLYQNIFYPPLVPKPEELAKLIPSYIPTWGKEPEHAAKIKATWLGHAAFLIELPAPEGATRGPRILFDPAFSEKCSPTQWFGPTRYTKVPCKLEEIPVIDAIVISHNHYDHMDAPTLKALQQKHQPHVFCPLGNEALLTYLGFDDTHAHSLDWWDNRSITITLPSSDRGIAEVKTTFKLTCTPAQHQANRSVNDRMKSLWSSWVLEGESPGTKVYFAGDTAYRTVLRGEDEEKVPVCPAFKEIGEQFDGFDLALLPIGAYESREVMSCVHSSPSDSVGIFKDVRAKKALAMHWGTWILTPEPIMEPPQKLKEACAKAGIAPGVFDVCGLGETRFF